MWPFTKTAHELRVEKLLTDIRSELRRNNNLLLYLGRPARPNPSVLISISEDQNMLSFELLLTPPNSPDVVRRALDVTIVGGDSISLDLTPEVATISDPRFVGEQDAAVTVTLVDFDDVGNRSAPYSETLTLSDTIAPNAPGPVSLRATAEFDAPAAEPEAPAPEPEAPAADETVEG